MNVFTRIAVALEQINQVQSERLVVEKLRLTVEKQELAALQKIAAEIVPPPEPGLVTSQSIVFGVTKK